MATDQHVFNYLTGIGFSTDVAAALAGGPDRARLGKIISDTLTAHLGQDLNVVQELTNRLTDLEDRVVALEA